MIGADIEDYPIQLEKGEVVQEKSENQVATKIIRESGAEQLQKWEIETVVERKIEEHSQQLLLE